jgi:hypothetical protein
MTAHPNKRASAFLLSRLSALFSWPLVVIFASLFFYNNVVWYESRNYLALTTRQKAATVLFAGEF